MASTLNNFAAIMKILFISALALYLSLLLSRDSCIASVSFYITSTINLIFSVISIIVKSTSNSDLSS